MSAAEAAGASAEALPAPREPFVRRPAFALLLTLALSGGLHLAFGDVDLNLSDEGFLWYGVERTLEGRVPMRDFQAYDPGRYWWCAGFARLFGPGIATLRLALAAFGALGLFLGLRALQRALAGPLALVLAACVLALWIFPRHKTFEPAVALACVWVLARLAERPTAARHLHAGLFVGLAGVMGRNHLLYAGLAFLCVFAWSAWRARRAGEPAPGARGLRGIGAALAGGLAGLSPLWLSMLLVPGFARAYADSLVFFLEQPTNQALPWPWPWRLGFEHLAAPERAALALAFLLPPLGLAAGLAASVPPRRGGGAPRAVLAAATLSGLFYAHHVAVRSDPWHLAQAVGPVLCAVMVLPAALSRGARARWIEPLAPLALLAASLLAVPATNPALAPARLAGPRPLLAEVRVAGDVLRLPARLALYVERVKAVLARRLAAGELLLVAPGHTTLYPLAGRRSPFHDVYFLWSAGEERQRAMARALEAGEVRDVLIVDAAVDGRPELLFRNTNPLVWAALERSFVRVPTPELPPDHALLRWRGR